MQPETPATPGWMKALIGCAVGCGVLCVIGVIGAGAGAWWFVRPGEQRRTAAIASPEASGTFHVGDLGGDPGMIALLDRFILEAQRQQQTGMPPWMVSMQQMSAAGTSPSTGFRLLLPREATVSMERSPEGDEAVLVAFNPRGMTKLLGLVLSGESARGEYRGHEVGRMDENGWGALVDGTFVFSTEEWALRAGIDRLEEGLGAAPIEVVDLGPGSREWDLTGVMANDDGSLERLLWEEGGAPAGMRRASFGVDLATGDLLAGRVLVDCESAAAADATLRALHAKVAERARELAGRDLDLRAALRAEQSRAVLDWEVHGLDAALSRWVTETAAGPPVPADLEPEPAAGF